MVCLKLMKQHYYINSFYAFVKKNKAETLEYEGIEPQWTITDIIKPNTDKT